MPSLIRQFRLHTAFRHLSLSAIPRSRGTGQSKARPRGSDIVDTAAPDVPPIKRSSFAAQRKEFDLGRYADAVRGDLDPSEERDHFLEQKAPWMAPGNPMTNQSKLAYRSKNDLGGRREALDEGIESKRHDVEELESLDKREPDGPSKYQEFARKQVERNAPQRKQSTRDAQEKPDSRFVPIFRPRDKDKEENVEYYKPKPKHYELSSSGRKDQILEEPLIPLARNLQQNPIRHHQNEQDSDEDMDEDIQPSRTYSRHQNSVQRPITQKKSALNIPSTSDQPIGGTAYVSKTTSVNRVIRQEFRSADPTASAAHSSSRRKPVDREYQQRNELFNGFQSSEVEELQPRDRKRRLEDPKPSSSFRSRENVSSGGRPPKKTPVATKNDQFEEDDEDDVSARYSQERGAKVSARSEKSMKAGKIKRAYTLLSDGDKTFQATLTDVKNRKFRAKNRKILLEGPRLINEALENGARVRIIFFSKPDLMVQLSNDGMDLMQPELYQVSQKQMGLWSDMTTPPGIIAIADMPASFDKANTMPLTVILDNIRDPGNMGAIIRVLAGAGCSQIIAMNGCVDPWDPKVIRSGMGGHFHVPIQWNIQWDVVTNYLENPATVYIADNLEEKGVDPLALSEDTKRPRLWRRRNHAYLDTLPYHKVDFWSDSVILIIGGETHGVSEEAYMMTKERRGKKLVIPMGNDMESLNAASAVAILAFEMKRQRLVSADELESVGTEREKDEADRDEDSEDESSSDESTLEELQENQSKTLSKSPQ